MKKRDQLFVLLLAASVLPACGVRPRTVVQQEPGTSRQGSSSQAVRGAREHLVARGDTLYGIAFRHGVDYRDLARWNAINAPYTIYPGQRLRLSGQSTSATAAAPTRNPGRTTTPVAATSGVPTPTRTPVSNSSPSTNPQQTSAPVAVVTTPAPVTPSVTSAPNVTPAPPANTPMVSTGSTRLVQGINWRWPATGQIISRYVAGDQTRQGVGIGGSSGQAVVAAADGEVVYSGAGLIGYGELIIVRHSDEFLSAYGHNRKRLVNEGQRVKAGQQVAEMGRTGTSRDMLHFEVRKNGKPLDPMGFLPAR